MVTRYATVLPIITTCSQKAQISDVLNKWPRDVRELEATWSPTSKEGTLDSLKTFVEGLRAVLHATTQSVEAIESPTEHGRTPLGSLAALSQNGARP